MYSSQNLSLQIYTNISTTITKNDNEDAKNKNEGKTCWNNSYIWKLHSSYDL